ncbi:MAG: hypothetical protein ACC742_10685 [Thermoanaerobaculales bacterium]
MRIPASVQALFWEYSVDQAPSGEGWEKTIIERVMQRGCWKDMLWLLHTFSRSRLRSFLEQRGKRAIAPRELRFWATMCGVPGDVQDAWVREARARERAWRG